MKVVAVVDDTADVRRMVRLVLERAGATVEHEASSIDEALAVLHPASDGVIILDHHLDGPTRGFDGAALLKERAPAVRVVLFSALDLAREAADNPAIDAFVRKDRILELPQVVLLLDRSGADAEPPDEEELAARRAVISASDLLLARWLSSPSVMFGTLPPPLESSDVIGQLIAPTAERTDVVLRFVAAAGDIDVAVAHLLVLRRLIDTQSEPRVHIDLDLLDLLIVEVTSNVIASARRAALVDPLTGIGNRRALELELTSALARCERTGQQLTVLYFDMVGLKSINDRTGHAEGDRSLVAFARALELIKRTGDSSYRVGGDEFVAVLPDTAPDQAERFAQRLYAAGAPEFSMGVAGTSIDGYSVARLVRVADVRMLQSRYQREAHTSPAPDLRIDPVDRTS